MIAATSIRRSAPRFLHQVMAAGRPNTFYSVIGSQTESRLQQGWTNHSPSHSVVHSYSFSTAALDETVVLQTPGTVTKKLRVLNMDTVKDILKELNAVDRNSDGRYVYICRRIHVWYNGASHVVLTHTHHVITTLVH